MSFSLQTSYTEWERDLIDIVIRKFDCPNGDAQGIVEAKERGLYAAYTSCMLPMDAFNKIINKNS